MNNFDNLFPENLYHSYVIEGDLMSTAEDLLCFLEIRGEIEKQSPDVLCQFYESFNIDDGSRIKEWHSKLGITNSKKVCIIGAKFINREAEQALLKIIEEPAENTHFFIIIPDVSLLLDTILSRVHFIKNINNDKENIIAEKFIKLSPTARIEKINEIIKEFKDSESSGSLRFKAIDLINGIEKIIYKEWKKDINDENKKFILGELKNCRNFLSSPGASVKMILEHIALVL